MGKPYSFIRSNQPIPDLDSTTKIPIHVKDILTARKTDFEIMYNELDKYIYSIYPTMSNHQRKYCVRDILFTNGKVWRYNGYDYFIPYNRGYFDTKVFVNNYCIYTLCRLLRFPPNIILEYPENVYLTAGNIHHYTNTVVLSMFIRNMIGSISSNTCYSIATDPSIVFSNLYEHSENYTLPKELIKEIYSHSLPPTIYEYKVMLRNRHKNMYKNKYRNKYVSSTPDIYDRVTFLIKTVFNNYKLSSYEEQFIKYIINHLTDIPLTMIKINIENRLNTFKNNSADECKIIIEDLYQTVAMYATSILTPEEKVLVNRALILLRNIYIKKE